MGSAADARRRFMRDAQLQGYTYEQAAQMWKDGGEIAETFMNDGIRTADQLTGVDIRDAIADYKAIQRALQEDA